MDRKNESNISLQDESKEFREEAEMEQKKRKKKEQMDQTSKKIQL